MRKIYLLITCILIMSMLAGCNRATSKDSSNLQIDTSHIYKCVIGIEDDDNNGWWTEIYEEGTKKIFADKFGLDVAFRKYNPNASPKDNLLGENAIDLLISMNCFIPDEYMEGYFVDMNEYRNQMPDYWNKWMKIGDNWERDFEKCASRIMDTKSNKLYGVSSISNFSFPSLVWMYKEDVFKKYGIDFPSTIEELYQTALDLKEKTGKPPIWFYGRESLEAGISFAYGTTFSSFYLDMQESEYRYALLDETWLDAMKMIINMQKEELIIIGHLDKSTKIDENAVITCTSPGSLRFLKEQDISWKLAPNILTSEKSDISTTYLFLTPQNKFYCINAISNVEVKKRLITLINWLATDEGIMKAWFGEEGKTYKLNNNIIEIVFQGVSHIDCVAGVVTDDIGIKGIEGKFKEFHNYALGRPFYIASPKWENYKGEELNVYIEAFEIMKNLKVIETISTDEIEAKTNEKYWNIFNKITKCESQFFKDMKNTGWTNMDESYKSYIADIEKKGVHELLDYLNNKID